MKDIETKHATAIKPGYQESFQTNSPEMDEARAVLIHKPNWPLPKGAWRFKGAWGKQIRIFLAI